MTSSNESALERAVRESIEAWAASELTDEEAFELRQAERRTVRERLELMAELSSLAASVRVASVRHERMRGRLFLL